MIQRLALRRWRAFDTVAIDFNPGTTFLVAPNGIGKTSLLLGLTWALFGEHSNVDAKTCVRIGHESAEATITISVGGNRQLTIHRTITTSGKTTVEYSDGQPLADDIAQRMLADEFGAPIEIAARLAVIRGSGKDDGELQLREHLYDAFGVSELRRAAVIATKLHKDAVAARKRMRSASRSQLANRGQLSALADKLRGDIDELNIRRAPLTEAIRKAQQAERSVAAWTAFDVESAARAATVNELLVDAADRGLLGTQLEDLQESVSGRIDAIGASIGQAQQTLAEARAQVLAARSALDLLEGHDPTCPTCARPFHGDELERAVAAQNHSLTMAQKRIAVAEQGINQLTAEKEKLNEFRARVQALTAPLPEPGTPRPTEDTDASLAAAENALRVHDELAGSVTSERDAIVNQLASGDKLLSAYEAERIAWRREAITQATAAALTATAERIANEHIEPLSRHVRWRWKALFGEDGLQLRADGTIVRVVGDRELSWSQLSSGEQIWARLVASLLVLQASTTLPFAWLDEPLEHLDPRARRIVATDLTNATRSGRPAQLLVTTYEHTLARQLADDLADTHLRHINRSETVALPPRRRTQSRDTGGETSPAA